MLNYERLIHSLIGKRIRDMRNNAGVLQDAFYGRVSVPTLSLIENGKQHKNRNPQFLNADLIAFFSNASTSSGRKLQPTTPKNLIWGTYTNRCNLIKIIIWSLVINNRGFLDMLDYAQRCPTLIGDREIDEVSISYFMKESTRENYKKIEASYDDDYQKISCLIIKQMMNLDEDFSVYFTRVVNQHAAFEESIYSTLEEFLLNKGNYSYAIMHPLTYKYSFQAFDKLWNRVETNYLEFFDKHLFSLCPDNINVEIKGLKSYLSNEMLHQLIISDEFIELNEKSLLMPVYSDPEAILSNLRVRMLLVDEIRLARKSDSTSTDQDDEFAPFLETLKTVIETTTKDYISRIEQKKKEVE